VKSPIPRRTAGLDSGATGTGTEAVAGTDAVAEAEIFTSYRDRLIPAVPAVPADFSATFWIVKKKTRDQPKYLM
jgi:hypothetical protein